MVKITVTKKQLALLKAHISKSASDSEAMRNLALYDNYIVASDGKTACYIECSSIFDSGCYAFIGAPDKLAPKLFEISLLKLDIDAPNFKAVKPDLLKLKSTALTLDNTPLNTTSAVLKVFELTGNAINFEYLHRIAKANPADYLVYYSDKDKPIVLVDSEAKAEIIVLPFKYKQKANS